MSENIWQPQTSWTTFVASDYRLTDVKFRRKALLKAREIMKITRSNVNKIIKRLRNRKYQFVQEPHIPPLKRTVITKWVKELAEDNIFIPIAFQAWMEEVGSVNLMGTDPSWQYSGYDSIGPKETWCTDPLVVETDIEYTNGEIENWKQLCNGEYYEQISKDSQKDFIKNWGQQYFEEWKERLLAEQESDQVGPYRIDFAPDDLHKANCSGGMPYALCTARPTVDPLVLWEAHCYSFVAHIRHAFTWGGFPGFEDTENRPIDFIEEMKFGLQSI